MKTENKSISVRAGGRMHDTDRRSVLHLVDYAGPYSGNFIASLLSLNAVLRGAGLRQVMIFPAAAGNRPWIGKVLSSDTAVYFLQPETSLLSIVREVARVADRENAVILHSHFTTYDVAAWLAAALPAARRCRSNVVWHAHSAFPVRQSVKRRIKDLIKYRLMGRSVKMITVSEELQRSIAGRGFAGESNVILNGVDIDRAAGTDKSRAAVRNELGIANDDMVLLSFGWEPLTKGVDILLEAALRLCNVSKFTLVIVGDDKLKEFISASLGENLPGWLRIAHPRDNVADFYKAADVFISASRWEGCPYSVMEAMSNGLPVISSDIGGLDWAKEAGHAILFESENSEGLLRVMRRAITMKPREIESIAAASIELINKSYSADRWAANIYSIYRKILESNSLFFPPLQESWHKQAQTRFRV